MSANTTVERDTPAAHSAGVACSSRAAVSVVVFSMFVFSMFVCGAAGAASGFRGAGGGSRSPGEPPVAHAGARTGFDGKWPDVTSLGAFGLALGVVGACWCTRRIAVRYSCVAQQTAAVKPTLVVHPPARTRWGVLPLLGGATPWTTENIIERRYLVRDMLRLGMRLKYVVRMLKVSQRTIKRDLAALGLNNYLDVKMDTLELAVS